jgi:hypothetical protein
MRKPIAAAIVAASAATGACGQTHAEDSGATVSRNYQVGAFQKIEVAGPYDVAVRTGSKVSVSANGSEKLLERTIVEVQGDRLVIRPERRKGWFQMGWSHRGNANFTVTVPELTAAAIAGSGDIHINQVKGEQFAGTIAGSGELDIDSVDVQALKLSISGSGSAKAAAGQAQSADYSIAGSGDIDARAVQAQQAKVSIAGSGGVKAHASDTAKVSIMGSGDVDMTGGAKCSVSKAGSGNVNCS